MSDSGPDKTQSKNADQAANSRLAAAPTSIESILANAKVLSAEDIDNMIFEHDPELLQTQLRMNADPNMAHNELIDLDRALEEERLRSFKFRLKVGFSKIIYRIEYASLSLVRRSRDFVMVRLPMLGKQALYYFKVAGHVLKTKLQAFMGFPTKQKIAAVVLVLLVGVFFSFVKYLLKGNTILNPKENLFILNLAEVATTKMKFNPNTDMELFYDSPRVQLSQVSLGRLVVNLKKSSRALTTPMIAVELVVETISDEIAIEIKDRESEIKDLVARKIEELTFENIESQSGKVVMLDRIRDELNRNLEPGSVRKVRIKTIVVKQ